MQKNKAEEHRRVVRSTDFDNWLLGDLLEEVTFEQRPDWSKGTSMYMVWANPARGYSRDKAWSGTRVGDTARRPHIGLQDRGRLTLASNCRGSQGTSLGVSMQTAKGYAGGSLTVSICGSGGTVVSSFLGNTAHS